LVQCGFVVVRELAPSLEVGAEAISVLFHLCSLGLRPP
jgi:hypothetical protein